jgi:dGTPase
MTPEGEVVSWADRIAYVCHDFEDAVDARIVALGDLPEDVAALAGRSRREQLSSFIVSMIRATAATGRIGMEPDNARALALFRQFNYERVYLRQESKRQADQVIALLRALVDFYCTEPWHLPLGTRLEVGDPATRKAAVAYVAGMTDRFACRQAILRLGWDESRLPQGIDV